MSGCPDGTGDPSSSVSLPASDTTTPIAKLDIFNLPAQAASSPANPESVDSGCCPATFVVPIGLYLDVIGLGEDFDGGVRSAVIWYEVTSVCIDPTSELGQERRAIGRLDVKEDTSSPSPGGNVRTRRIAQGRFRIADYAPKCLPEAPQRDSVSA